MENVYLTQTVYFASPSTDTPVVQTASYALSGLYQTLEHEMQKQDRLFARALQNSERYPQDKLFRIDLLSIDKERNHLRKKQDAFHSEVLHLEQAFSHLSETHEHLQQAKTYFEAGEYSSTRTILELETERLSKEQNAATPYIRKELAEQLLMLARLHILDYSSGQHLQKAYFYFTQSLKSFRFLDNTLAFARFLHIHHHYTDALPLYEEALKLAWSLVPADEATYMPEIALIHTQTGNAHMSLHQYPEAEAHFEKARTIYTNLANTEAYTFQLAMLEDHLSRIYKIAHQYQEAMSHSQKAWEFFTQLHVATSPVYLSQKIVLLTHRGVLQKHHKQYKEAEQSFQEALSICQQLAQNNPYTYLPDVAHTWNHLGNTQKALRQYKESSTAYQKALDTYQLLTEENSAIYLPHVAQTLCHLGSLQSDYHQHTAAEDSYIQALEIYQQLQQEHPDKYISQEASILNNLGVIRKDTSRYQEAEHAYLRSLALYQQLAEENSQTHLPDVALLFNNLGSLQLDFEKLSEAELSYQNSLNVYKQLAEENTQTYQPYVAMVCVNMSIMYRNHIPSQEQSLYYVKECIHAAKPFLGRLPAIQNYYKTVLTVIQSWGLDPELFLREV